MELHFTAKNRPWRTREDRLPDYAYLDALADEYRSSFVQGSTRRAVMLYLAQFKCDRWWTEPS